MLEGPPLQQLHGDGSSPILHGDLLIVHFDGYDVQYAVALDKSTGRTVWRAERTHDYRTGDGDRKKAYATPVVVEAGGRSQLVSQAAKAVLSLDPATGRELWRVRHESHSAQSLRWYGKDALPTLLGATETNSDPVVRRICARIAVRLDAHRTLPSLLRRLASDDIQADEQFSAGLVECSVIWAWVRGIVWACEDVSFLTDPRVVRRIVDHLRKRDRPARPPPPPVPQTLASSA